MKKKMIVLLAGALMALSASSAFASFGNGQLSFYAYNNLAGSSEVGVNLGSISSLLATGADTTISIGASNVAALMTGATSIYAGLYGFDSASGNVYVIANEGLGSFNATLSAYTGFKTQNTAVNTAYAGTALVKTITSKGTSATSDYFGKMDKGVNGQGNLNALFATGKGGDFQTSLAADVTKAIYMFDATGTTFNDTGATAIFKTDGSVEVVGAAAAPTPIPPAFLLMGSGLLGMVGLRRKKA